MLLGGCGPSTSPQTLLKEARTSLDSTQTVHFTLISTNVVASGTYLVAAQGSAKRPDGFTGTLTVSQSGIPLPVKIVSLGGSFYVQLPFSSSWQTANPTDYGFGDPAQLLDPKHGLTSLLTNATAVTLNNQDRYNGELLDEVSCDLSGASVAALLTSADSARNDQAIVGIDADTHQLRRVAITGPFVSVKADSTYTLVLSNYGEPVTITKPA